MQIPGHVENGVIVLDQGNTLPDGTMVVVVCASSNTPETNASRVEFPLVESTHPGSLSLTSDQIGDLLADEDVSA